MSVPGICISGIASFWLDESGTGWLADGSVAVCGFGIFVIWAETGSPAARDNKQATVEYKMQFRFRTKPRSQAAGKICRHPRPELHEIYSRPRIEGRVRAGDEQPGKTWSEV
jgi:hypothetical protein